MEINHKKIFKNFRGYVPSSKVVNRGKPFSEILGWLLLATLLLPRGVPSKVFKNKIPSGSRFYQLIVLGKIPLDNLEIVCRVCNAWHYLKEKFGEAPFKILWGKVIYSSTYN